MNNNGGDDPRYDFVFCSKCSERYQNIDFGGISHGLGCTIGERLSCRCSIRVNGTEPLRELPSGTKIVGDHDPFCELKREWYAECRVCGTTICGTTTSRPDFLCSDRCWQELHNEPVEDDDEGLDDLNYVDPDED